MPRAGSSGATRFIPCITYQTLFGGRPIHYHVEKPTNTTEWRELEECESEDCRALITNCDCGFVYRLDAIENYIKKYEPDLLKEGDVKLPARNGACEMCSKRCSRCHPKKKLEHEKLHVYKGTERNLCPAHARMGDTNKHEAQKADDINKAEKIFERLLADPREASRIYGQGGWHAYMDFTKLCHQSHAQGRPRPDVRTWVTDFLAAQNGYNLPKQSNQAGAIGPNTVDTRALDDQADGQDDEPDGFNEVLASGDLSKLANCGMPSQSDAEMFQHLHAFNSSFPAYANGYPRMTAGALQPGVSEQPWNMTSGSLLPSSGLGFGQVYPDGLSASAPRQHITQPQQGLSHGIGSVNQYPNHFFTPAPSMPESDRNPGNPGAYRDAPVFPEDDEDDDGIDLDHRGHHKGSLSSDPFALDEGDPTFWQRVGVMSPPRHFSNDTGGSTAPETNIITPFTPALTSTRASPPTVESLKFDFEVLAGIQRLAGSFLSKHPNWQTNIYKTIYTADPGTQVQLPEHLDISDIEQILYHLPKVLFNSHHNPQHSTIPTAYNYDVHTAVIRLLAHNVPALPKKQDSYNTPIQRPGHRRHYFDTVTLHFGPYSIERDGVLIDPERVHLRWVHECMSWVVCEVLEGEGHPHRVLELLDAQMDLLLDLKDINGIKMVTRARIDCVDQGCPLHCDYTRMFTGVIAIVVITAERACLQAYRSGAWEELDKRRNILYRAMKVAAKMLDCNSVNLYRTLVRLEDPKTPPENRDDLITRCKIYDGIVEKLDRLHLTFVDYRVMQKDHDIIETNFLTPGGAYWELSERASQRSLDFKKSWIEFDEYMNDPKRVSAPCHELFIIPRAEMAESQVLRRWEEFVGGDYLRNENIQVRNVYETEPDTALKGPIKRLTALRGPSASSYLTACGRPDVNKLESRLLTSNVSWAVRHASHRSTLSSSAKSKLPREREDKLDNHQHTFDKAFHTSSVTSTQPLPDHSLPDNHVPSHPSPRSIEPLPDNWPNRPSFPSRQRTPHLPTKERWTDRKGKGKANASTEGNQAAPPAAALRPHKRIEDKPEFEQGQFDISPEILNEVFRDSLQVDDLPLGLKLTEEEALGLAEALGESSGTILDDDWDLDDGAGGVISSSTSAKIPLMEDYPEYDLASASSEDVSSSYDPFAPSSSTVSAPQNTQQLLATDPTIVRSTIESLPPLPVPDYPPDDKTRFDWRQRALSRRKHLSRYKWFGQLPRRKDPSWTKLQFGERGREELDRYSQHFIPLLEAEQAEEERLYNARLADWSFDRLRREGYAMDEMRGSLGYQPKSLAGIGTVYNFVKGKGDRELPFNRFTIGSNIIISRTDPLRDPVSLTPDGKNKIIGSVWNATKGNLRIMFPVDIPDILSGNWRLDVACSDFAIRRQIEAIKALNLDPIQQDMEEFPEAFAIPNIAASEQDAARSDLAVRSLPSPFPKEDQTILRGTSIRDLLFRAFQEDYLPPQRSNSSANASTTSQPGLPAHQIVQDTTELRPSDLDTTPVPSMERSASFGVLAKNQLIQSWIERHRGPGAPVTIEGDHHVGLNESQMRAIAMMLGERFSLVQGPPGTGKTRVIIETIKLLKKHWQIPHPILVTAHTNVAVDNLLSGLRAHDVKAVRFGAINRIPEEYGDWTLDRLIGKHPRWWYLEEARKEKEVLAERKLKLKELWTGEDEARLIKLGQTIWAIRQAITREVLLDADVICTTCLSATSKALHGIDFPIVFLDEASMATEPLSLVPLTKGSSHVAIIGDHKQLPPVIVSPAAHAGGLATSLFERLIHEGNIPSIMLDTQYRMHPSLASFPSQTFYSGLLKSGTPASHRQPPETEFLALDDEGKRKNFTFLNHDHPESPMSKSLANYGDAEYACDVIADLMYKNPKLRGSQIGIITPYLSQFRLLSNHLTDPKRRQAFTDLIGPDRTSELDDIEIKTVDGFEGREKEVIIFSCVRSNDGGWIGFLGDWRRVNVALTRARKALIMIGSKKTLEKARIGKNGAQTLPSGGARVWRELIAHLEGEKAIMDLE
ncbi:uncharacterized protein I303_104522 [Kwoniella dejecticola CBS 10117]|uniref:DNA helicase n=1 Tax=Kwoniella dejecticola CBS 10117 TaxID=1296121 RepID=A0AAJ8MFX4_9TREE